jgi:hypothetical protein
MQRTWCWLFQPATVFVVAALLVLAIPLLQLGWRSQGALIVLLLGYLFVVRRFRTTTGAED